MAFIGNNSSETVIVLLNEWLAEILAHSSLQMIFKSAVFHWSLRWIFIFRDFHKILMGFNSGTDMAAAKTSTLFSVNHCLISFAACLGSLSYRNVKSSPRSNCWMELYKYSWRLSRYVAPFIIPSITWSAEHGILLYLLRTSLGMVFLRA